NRESMRVNAVVMSSYPSAASSGLSKSKEHPALPRSTALAAPSPCDIVMVTRIDRLARSTLDLFGIVKRIVDAKAQFRSLPEPWADTGTSSGRLMLAVLGELADVERDLIHTPTAEGRSRQDARKAQRPSPFPDTGTAERGHQTPRAGRYAARTGQELQ